MKRLVQVFLVACCLTAVTGCATIHVRGSRDGDGEFYPALNADRYAIKQAWAKHYGWTGGYRIPPLIAAVITLFHIVDMPISLVTDTVSLPIDIKRYKERPTMYFGVCDERNVPVPGATIRTWQENFKTRVLTTDTNGIAAFPWNYNLLSTLLVTKQGHYETKGSPTAHFDFQKYLKRYMTNNTHKILLMTKRDPVPLVHNVKSVRFPTKKGNIGFDLMAADLVSEKNHGKHSHMFICLNNDGDKMTGDIRFPNQNDGILISDKVIPDSHDMQIGYWSDYYAPTNGYHGSLLDAIKASRSHVKKSSSRNRVLYFRVTDPKTLRPLYGKIYWMPHFIIHRNGHSYLEMRYFLNPTGSRNIEYNGKNLGPGRNSQYR